MLDSTGEAGRSKLDFETAEKISGLFPGQSGRTFRQAKLTKGTAHVESLTGNEERGRARKARGRRGGGKNREQLSPTPRSKGDDLARRDGGRRDSFSVSKASVKLQKKVSGSLAGCGAPQCVFAPVTLCGRFRLPLLRPDSLFLVVLPAPASSSSPFSLLITVKLK